MTTDVEQVHRETILVDPVVSEAVSAERRRRNERPPRRDDSFDRLAEKTLDVVRGLLQFAAEMRLTDFEQAKRLVSLDRRDVAGTVISNAGHEFEGVGKLDDVVVRATPESLGLRGPLLAGTQDDDRNLRGVRCLPIGRHEIEPVHLGHHQILQDHRGIEFARGLDRLRGILAVRVGDALLRGEDASHRLADHRLVVDEQHADSTGTLVL